ncbi:MAG: SDR family oxidoreductase [Miltoncostaeaceae bacterium]
MSRRVLVTGGASGIGLAVVEAFTRLGDRVVSLDRRESAAAAASVVGDVTDVDAQARAVEEAGAGTGALDVLIANAGVHDGGANLALPAEELAQVTRSVLDVDVVGYVLSLQAAAYALTQARGCAILTLSDSAYLAGHTGAGIAYTAAKYAGVGIVKWAARALAPAVRVNAVAPGGIITGLQAVSAEGSTRGLFDDAEVKSELIRSRNVLGSIMSPADLAELYVFLAGSTARGMTGEILRPDGGLGVS